MPELPEVEVICRGLRPHLIGRTVISVRESGKKLRHPIPIISMAREMNTSYIISVERRAKYIQITLNSDAMLVIHLGMTGNLGIFAPLKETAKHDHVIWTLDNETELRYNDSRRFGSVRFLSAEEALKRDETIFKTTGPEPFSDSFTATYLHQLAKDKNIAVKAFIMTNQVVTGVGNIYANESLFAAGIRPSCRVKKISKKRWAHLVTQIRKVLQQAITCGGSTISDYINASQEKGYFQMNFMVYGRNGEICYNCTNTIQKRTIGGRASYFCPTCQK